MAVASGEGSGVGTDGDGGSRLPSRPGRGHKRPQRAVAADGLSVEDLLQRLEFDEELQAERPASSSSSGRADVGRRPPQFSMLVDPVDHTQADRPPSPCGSKWCWTDAWLGACKFGLKCRYAHFDRQLVMWRPDVVGYHPGAPLLPPVGARVPMSPMIEVSLETFLTGEHPNRSLCFALFEGRVVWGRDFGRFGAHLWSNFEKDRRGVSGRDPGEACDWVSLPPALWDLILGHIPAVDLPALVLALPLGLLDWGEVINERWPLPPPKGEAKVDGLPSKLSTHRDLLGAARELVSLCSSSHAAAQLLLLPEIVTPAPPYPPVEVAHPGGYVCEAVLSYVRELPEPGKLRVEGEVHPGSLSLDETLLVLQANGDVRALRRSDLKQVSGIRTKEATCVDIRGELLAVGTQVPARLFAFDLLESVQSRPQRQLRLYQGPTNSGTQLATCAVAFVGANCCVCGLAMAAVEGPSTGQAFRGAPLAEVILVDCGGAALSALRRLDPPGSQSFLSILGAGCVTSGEGELSLWTVSWDGDAETRETRSEPATRQPLTAPCAPSKEGSRWPQLTLASDAVHGRFAALAHGPRGGPEGRAKGLEISALDLREGAPGMMTPALPLQPPVEMPGFPPAWNLRLLHTEGPLLVAVLAQPNEASRVFAWHLPTGRPLILGRVLQLQGGFLHGEVTAFAQQRSPPKTHFQSHSAPKPRTRGLVFAVSVLGSRERFLVLPYSPGEVGPLRPQKAAAAPAASTGTPKRHPGRADQRGRGLPRR